MKIKITIDLEEAKHSNLGGVEGFITRDFESNVQKLLDLLKEYNMQATFFVVGETAQKHPQVIKNISDTGHEIASHSMRHKLVYKMSEEEFGQDTRECKKALEEITGQNIKGYRAPSWSAHSKKTPWFWQVLKDEGYRYSSSIMPFKTFLYGDPDFLASSRNLPYGVKEIPPATIKILGKNIPFSGGFYFRMLPWFFIKWAVKKELRIRNYESGLIFYFHLRDIDLEKPPKGIGFKAYLIQYARARGGKKKFIKLLKLSSYPG